jgi:hypothetical protein
VREAPIPGASDVEGLAAARLRKTHAVFVLAGLLGVVFVVLLGYTSGPVLAFVAAARRQRRARSVFRRLSTRR